MNDKQREHFRRFQEEVFVHFNEIYSQTGPVTSVPFWKALSIGFYLAKGLSVEDAVALASETFNPWTPDPYELAKSAKWTGVMPNNPATEFVLFENGEIVRTLTLDEAKELCPGVRTFPI